MVQAQNRTIEIIVILLMLSASPLSVTYTFADLSDYLDEKDSNPDVPKDVQNSRLRIILTEKLVEAGLVESVKTDRNRVFQITEKGLQFFQEFKKFQGLVESMNLRY